MRLPIHLRGVELPVYFSPHPETVSQRPAERSGEVEELAVSSMLRTDAASSEKRRESESARRGSVWPVSYRKPQISAAYPKLVAPMPY